MQNSGSASMSTAAAVSVGGIVHYRGWMGGHSSGVEAVSQSVGGGFNCPELSA